MESEFESRLSGSRVHVFSHYPVLPSDKPRKYVIYKALFYGIINFSDITNRGDPLILICENCWEIKSHFSPKFPRDKVNLKRKSQNKGKEKTSM